MSLSYSPVSGPVAINWANIEGDIYSAQLGKSTFVSDNCAYHVEQGKLVFYFISTLPFIGESCVKPQERITNLEIIFEGASTSQVSIFTF